MRAHLVQYRALYAALVVAALFALLPVLDAARVIGPAWQGVPQSWGDEILYFNQIHEIADGNVWLGNQYFLEHSKGVPLIIFGGDWLAALPLLFGVPFIPALVFNDVLWCVILVALGYWLLRELYLPRWLAALGSLLSFMTCYGLMLRPANRQQVYPASLLLYLALVLFLKRHEKWSARIFLALSIGATFYVFSYLWQTAVITMGLLALFALYKRYWPLLYSTLIASALGFLVGLPPLLYMFWLSHHSPYFWESIARFGLVTTHLPEAEVIYSGGWIGVTLLLFAFLYWRARSLFADPELMLVAVFATVTGLGLWIMEGSNLITGKLLETGEHIRPFIGPWLPLVALPLLYAAWKARISWRSWERTTIVLWGVVLLCASSIFMHQYLYAYINPWSLKSTWLEEQGFAAPLRFIDGQQSQPVVIWAGPRDPISAYVPTLSRDYVLYSEGGVFTLVSNDEIHERYLVASYFDDPTVASLEDDLPNYVGRQDAYHRAKTIERGIKICRILHFWSASARAACGVVPTSVSLLGEPFFAHLQQTFADDIKPNIAQYLQKYHVSYIIVDTVLEPAMHPQALGAKRVWSNARYEVYKL